MRGYRRQVYAVCASLTAFPRMTAKTRDRAACWLEWAVTDSNRRHPACKAGALPAELTALSYPLSLRAPAGQVTAARRPHQLEAGLPAGAPGSLFALGAWKPAAIVSFWHMYAPAFVLP
jgi:hypothetical protein